MLPAILFVLKVIPRLLLLLIILFLEIPCSAVLPSFRLSVKLLPLHASNKLVCQMDGGVGHIAQGRMDKVKRLKEPPTRSQGLAPRPLVINKTIKDGDIAP